MAELNTTLITLLPLMTTDDEGSAVPFSGFPSKLENDGAGVSSVFSASLRVMGLSRLPLSYFPLGGLPGDPRRSKYPAKY